MQVHGAAPLRLRSIPRLISPNEYPYQWQPLRPSNNENMLTTCAKGTRIGIRCFYCRSRYSQVHNFSGRRLTRACGVTQLSSNKCGRLFCSLSPDRDYSRDHVFNADHELPQNQPSTCIDDSLVPSWIPMQSTTSATSSKGTSSSGAESCDAIRPMLPAPPTDPSPQIEAGSVATKVRDVSRSPQALVEYLDAYIIGQEKAKKAVAVALRQRWRRRQVSNSEMRADITPKNILLIGPTGVGKTEIARRLAKHLDAPFLKVEATKYTEVGFHGRDVDQIIKDLMEVAIKQKKTSLESQLRPAAEMKAEAKILETLAGKMPAEEYGMWLRHLRRGALDTRRIQIDLPMQASGGSYGVFSDLENALRDIKDTKIPSFFASDFRMMERRYVTIKEALSRLTQAELDSMITKEMVIQQAIEAVEQEGIVFIDEIDKICCKSGSGGYHGPDASDEGVQRDLLPLLEGSTVATRYGEIKTDYILFIASDLCTADREGAFHSVRPSDMLAELQGRLPVRVTLNPLAEEDFKKILTQTKHNLIEQHKALLATEGVVLEFSDDAISEVARVAWEVNSQVENIGARRLHTIIEKCVAASAIACL